MNHLKSKLLLLLYIGIYIFVYYTLYNDNIPLFIYESRIFIIPLFYLLMIIIFLHEGLKKKFPIRMLIYTLIFVSLLLYVFISYIFPLLTGDTRIDKMQAEERIHTAYKHATMLNDDIEIQSYIQIYNNYPEIFTGNGQLSITDGDLFGIPNRTMKKEAAENKPPIYQNLISTQHVWNMDKRDLNFNIQNYLEANDTSTAKVLLLYYQKIYGEDEEFLRHQKTIQKISSTLIENTHLEFYYNELDYFHSVIEQKHISADEVIFANNSFHAFITSLFVAKHPELVWIQERLVEKLHQYVFYTGDARKSLLSISKTNPIIFIENTQHSYLLWVASNARYIQASNTTYIENLEMISISKESKIINYHISTPYAKLQGNILYLNSIERGAINIQNMKKEKINLTNKPIPPIHQSSIVAKDIIHARPDMQAVKQKNFIELWRIYPIWKTGLLPLSMILDSIMKTSTLLLLFLLLGVGILYWLYDIHRNPKVMNQKTLFITVMIALTIPLQQIIDTYDNIILSLLPEDWLFSTIFMYNIMVLAGVMMLIIKLHQRTISDTPLSPRTS